MSLQSFSCIEKIKSTGATYMAASGLGGEQCHHNQNVIIIKMSMGGENVIMIKMSMSS